MASLDSELLAVPAPMSPLTSGLAAQPVSAASCSHALRQQVFLDRGDRESAAIELRRQ